MTKIQQNATCDARTISGAGVAETGGRFRKGEEHSAVRHETGQGKKRTLSACVGRVLWKTKEGVRVVSGFEELAELDRTGKIGSIRGDWRSSGYMKSCRRIATRAAKRRESMGGGSSHMKLEKRLGAWQTSASGKIARQWTLGGADGWGGRGIIAATAGKENEPVPRRKG